MAALSFVFANLLVSCDGSLARSPRGT